MQIVKGDITEQKVDAIVNAANAIGIMGAGVAGAISRVGGPSISEEARLVCKKHQFTPGQSYITKAGDLPCKHVIHAVTMAAPGGRTTPNTVDKCLRSVFEKAHFLQAKSIAIPGLGTKIGRAPVSDVAELYLQVIPEMEKQYGISAIICDIMDEFIDELLPRPYRQEDEP